MRLKPIRSGIHPAILRSVRNARGATLSNGVGIAVTQSVRVHQSWRTAHEPVNSARAFRNDNTSSKSYNSEMCSVNTSSGPILRESTAPYSAASAVASLELGETNSMIRRSLSQAVTKRSCGGGRRRWPATKIAPFFDCPQPTTPVYRTSVLKSTDSRMCFGPFTEFARVTSTLSSRR